VLRFARDLDYEIRRDRADPLRGRMVLQSPADANAPAAESVPEAIGFRLVADGIRARLDPGHLAAIPFDLPADLLARFRGEYYLHLLRTDTALSEVLNHFMAEWVWQISMAMLGATAVHNRCTLVEAQRRLASARSAAARRVLDRMFGIQGVDEHG
jgi:hypothetical protein